MNAASDRDSEARPDVHPDRNRISAKDGLRLKRTTAPAAQGRRISQRRWVRDLVACVAITIAVTITLAHVEAFELLHDATREFEDWDLDEILLGMMVLAFTSSGYAWRRWQDARVHLKARIAMEHELRSNAEDIDFLISAARGAFYACDANDGCVPTYVGPGIEAQTGHKPDFFLNDPAFWEDSIHPDDKDHVFADPGQLLRDNQQLCEYRIRHADGSYRWISDQRRLKRDADGNPDYIVGMRTDVTTHKQAERELVAAVEAATTELRGREAFLHLLTDHLPILIAYVGLDLRYRFINRTGAAWYARSKEDIVGKAVIDVIGEDSFSRLQARIDRARAGHNEKFETTVSYPDSRTRDVQILYVPDRNEDGALNGLIGMVIDITDRKRIEDELRRRQGELELILNHVPARIFYKDDQNRILRLNEPAARSLGMTVDQVEGANAYDLFPEIAKKCHDDDLEIINSGEPKLGIVEAYTHRDGKPGWIRTDKVPYQDPATGERSIFVASTDITVEKAAEEALRASEERYRTLYNETPAMLQSIDPEGGLLSVSDFWLEKLGYYRDEVIRRGAITFLTPESARKATDETLPELRRTGVCKDVDWQIMTKSGDVLDILVSAIAVRDEKGAVTRVMAVLTDVTERKVVERKLVQAQKMESVGQLTGGLAHDFNNLLGVVLGNLELIEQSTQGDDKMARRITTARDAVERGAELTQRLLAFSRRQRLETTSIAPNSLIAGLIDLLKRTLAESIVLHCRLGDGIPGIRSDAAQLESAILNLAVNARDAMPDGGTLVIESAVEQLDDDYAARENDVVPGDYVVISVTDTGVGIPADELQKVFEPFFTTKGVGKGSGLGLSMVYGFIKQTGGHVRIYSEVGRGTTVRMFLPVDRSGDPAETLPSAAPVQDVGGPERVLVVEDQDDVRDVAVALLENLGYTVFEAINGQQALTVLEARSEIDLLFTDIVMPGGMDGMELAKAARSLRPTLPVVFATGYAEAAVLREGEVKATGGLVTKPYRRADLATKIRQALAERKAAPEPSIAGNAPDGLGHGGTQAEHAG